MERKSSTEIRIERGPKSHSTYIETRFGTKSGTAIREYGRESAVTAIHAISQPGFCKHAAPAATVCSDPMHLNRPYTADTTQLLNHYRFNNYRLYRSKHNYNG
ncbi:hypothetical protein EVAR_60176_1 [Eumeta japonica]|uniref:Uncharacterized protein n=1 Tax=Eumeta variegata TaxID=151549 RepID=A0A4C1Z715_EUMVA|nr:hypothetical protein EVAR_60176_1 [Eumeta japonica]